MKSAALQTPTLDFNQNPELISLHSHYKVLARAPDAEA